MTKKGHKKLWRVGGTLLGTLATEWEHILYEETKETRHLYQKSSWNL